MIRKLFVATLLLGALASPAAAAKLTSTILYVPTVGSLACNATNVSNKDVPVTFKIVTLAGTATLTSTITLAPGASNGVSDGVQGNYHGRCEFVFPGTRGSVRAATLLYPGNTLPSLVLPAQ